MEIITDNGQHLDTPPGYTLDLELINPMLDIAGSQTAPATLPYTSRNLRLLDFPDRIDRARKYTIKRNTTLREGTFVRQATQAILKANRKDKIVTSFYFDEAIFYEKAKGLNLNTVNYLVTPSLPTAANPSVQRCKDFIFQVMRQDVESDFHVFPLLTKLEKYPNFLEMLQNSEILNKTRHDTNRNLIQLIDWSARTDIVNDAVITYPPGYGITVFLKISYILESIARELGYTVGNNIFKTHPELKHLVLINNVADTIVRGWIDYRQLLPARPVSDFIALLKKKFGAFIVVEESKKLLHIETIQQTITTQPDADLTVFLTEHPRIEWTSPRQVKLSAGTALPFSKTETELYEDFVKTHGQPEPFKLLGPDLILNKIYIDLSTNSYIMYIPDKESPAWQKTKLIKTSSANFAYYTKDQIDIEDLASDDEQLAAASLIELYAMEPFTIESYLLPIVGGRKNRNTTLYINDEAQKDENSEMPFMLCFRVPAAGPGGTRRITSGTPYASGFESGTWGNLSLTCQGENGLFNTFWKTYDNCLRTSFHTVQCSLNMPFTQLQQLKLHTPKLLFNQPVLIERIKCKIGNGKCQITEATFRTLRPYQD